MLQKTISSPLGDIRILADEHAVKGIWFTDQTHFGGKYDLDQIPFGDNPAIQDAQHWLRDYFQGKHPPIEFPIEAAASPFQEQVLQALRKIPYGQTRSYQEIAQAIEKETGRRSCPRAVGRAVATNPISLAIPCHRILASNGSLTGYAGGLERKKWLLELEAGKDKKM